MPNQQLKVLGRYGAYQTVSLDEVRSVLLDEGKKPDAQHVNAVGELADPAYLPLLSRALRSSDHLILRAVSGVAVKLKRFDLALPLRETAQRCDHPLSKSLLLAASVYLEHPDRGLSLILSRDPLALYLVTNLLTVRTFDLTDFHLAAGAFLRLAEDSTRKMDREERELWTESMMPDAINGLAGALM